MTSRSRLLVFGLSLLVLGGVEARAAAVLADRVLTDGPNLEYVPRFATYLPHVLVVPRGGTVTLPADSTWDAIEVSGTLRCDRSRDTTVRFTHLMILPGGLLDCGTADDPVLATVKFVVRDVPIDTARDPYQWGNGILNFGRQTRVGRRVTPFTQLAEDAAAGATTLRLAVPGDWRVGDELFLPDSHQLTNGHPIRRESPVFIASIGNGTITLSKPLEFEHDSVVEPDGAVVLRPRVANLTRNIVVSSENPLGTRGHTANLSHEASWDIRYNALLGLGRTLARSLDSTTADASGAITHIGTNQIAKYASHDHHGHGPGLFIGNVLDGTGIAKWGHSVHATHDAVLEDNIALNFVGSGFVTEDGFEVRNVFRRNLVALCGGNGRNAKANMDPKAFNCPGCEGAGFWFHSPVQTIEGNESWNNEIGVSIFLMSPVLEKYPSRPGSMVADTMFDPKTATPISVADNVTVSNKFAGWDQWATSAFPVLRTIAANNGLQQINNGPALTRMLLKDLTVVCTGGVSRAVESSAAYTPGIEVDGGRIVGCGMGFGSRGAIQYFRLRNLTLQNRVNINFGEGQIVTPEPMIFENVKHVPLGTFPKRYIVWGSTKTWQPGDPKPYMYWTAWNPPLGARGWIINWQGTGENYRLYENLQKRDAPAYPADGSGHSDMFCPEANMTVGQCWDKYGIAFGGGVVAERDAVELEGVSGVVAPGLQTSLGTPKYVLTSPNMLSPAKVSVVNGVASLRVRGILTGDGRNAAPFAYYELDNHGPTKVNPNPGPSYGDLSFALSGNGARPGTHRIRTWRVTPRGDVIRESELWFSYYVSEPSLSSDATPPAASGRREGR